jgi:hypothetical protein
MSRIVLNEALRSMLGDVSSPFPIYDEAGRSALFVTPANDRSLYEGEDTDLSEEELRRRESEGGMSFREALAQLQAKHS